MQNLEESNSVVIPFEGFYSSHISALIDDEETQILEDLKLDYDKVNFKIDFVKLSKHIVEAYKEYLCDELDLDIEMSFDILFQPREYNFMTDEITVLMPIESHKKLYDHLMSLDKKITQERVNNKYKSRDGFISFWSSFVNGWLTQPLCEWGNEQSELLMPLIDDDVRPFFYDNMSCNGSISECLEYVIL